MDYLDTRDLQETMENLKDEVFCAFIEEFLQYEEITESYEEIQSFLDLWKNEIEEIEEIQEIENNCSEFSFGETLINENYFKEYVKDLLTDCGYISRDFPHWIEVDWESTSENVKQDYSEIEYKNETYYFRQ